MARETRSRHISNECLAGHRIASYNDTERIMRPNVILAHVRKQPFVPFRVHISDGASYDVPHPEMILVTSNTVVIAQPPIAEGVPEHSVLCDPIHVTRIEPINGAKPKRRPAKRK